MNSIKINLILYVISIVIAVCVPLWSQISPGNPGNFITTWQTNASGDSETTQIRIGASDQNQSFDLYLENMDNASDNDTLLNIEGATDFLIDFPSQGRYRVEIHGEFYGINFDNGGDKQKLLSVEQWGDIQIESLFKAFKGCKNLEIHAVDTPDLSLVTSMFEAFEGAAALKNGLSHWDVGNVEIMSQCFKNTVLYNEDLNEWNVSQVNNMDEMFHSAVAFNGQIGDWDVSNVTSMESMFYETTSFNQPIETWDVSSVENMTRMFRKAGSFDQSLGLWNLTAEPRLVHFLTDSKLSCESYYLTLKGWHDNPATPDELSLDVRNIAYTDNAVPFREYLTDEKGWLIAGDFYRQFCGIEPGSEDNFITTWDTRKNRAGLDTVIRISGATFNYDLYWESVEDPTISGFVYGISSTYYLVVPNPGIYRVEILGNFLGPSFWNRDDLIALDQWGNIRWESISSAFRDCINMEYRATDVPNLENVTDIAGAFNGTRTEINGLEDWDVSNVVDFSFLFKDATLFNGDISSWDVSQGERFIDMFSGASTFDQNLAEWDVGRATRMDGMFRNATSFNQDISNWDVRSAGNLESMFGGAKSFDQNLGSWVFSNEARLYRFFDESGMSCENYDNTLMEWAQNPQTPTGIRFSAKDISYTNTGKIFRDTLKNHKDWIIVGDVLRSNCQMIIDDESNFITTWEVGKSNSPDSTTIDITSYSWLPADTHFDIYWESVEDPLIKDTVFGVTNSHEIEFPAPGKYKVQMGGTMPGFYFSDVINREKIIEINQWGDIDWVYMGVSFFNCLHLRILAPDTPDVSKVFSFAGAFANAKRVDVNLGSWDISSATDMREMLSGTGMSCENYKNTLRGWLENPTTPNDMVLGADSLIYSPLGADPRDSLINGKNWVFEGDFVRDFCSINPGSEDNFVSIWNTRLSEGVHKITIPTRESGYLYDVYWEKIDDPNINGEKHLLSSDYTIIVPDSGRYKLEISGDFPNLYFSSTEARSHLLEVSQWGSILWKSFAFAFRGCDHVQISAEDEFKVIDSISMEQMFRYTKNFNSDISGWDVSKVSNMEGMFENARSFNQDLGEWELASVTSLADFFGGSAMDCENLTNTISGWGEFEDISDSVEFGALNKGYSSAAEPAARFLQDEKNWTFNGLVNRQACAISVGDSSNFVTIWDSEAHPSSWPSSDSTIYIPIVESGNSFDVYWESIDDPTLNDTSYNWVGPVYLHLPKPGKYEIQISPGFRGLDFTKYFYSENQSLLDVKQWGSNYWETMENAFFKCVNVQFSAEGQPDLRNVRSMRRAFSKTNLTGEGVEDWDLRGVENLSELFYDADRFNGDISGWDVSTVKNMSGMFRDATSFNGELNNWDMSSVTDLSYMFHEATSFNQPLNQWRLDSVIDFSWMFYEATSFDQPLDQWNLSSAKDLKFMFYGATSFNQPLQAWNVSNVTIMWSMFYGATSFNQPLHTWNVSSVTNMWAMFYEASSFNQPLRNWDVSSVKLMNFMFGSATSFNQDLDEWDVSSVESMAGIFRDAINFNGSLSSWNTSSLMILNEAFSGATSFNQPLSHWNVSKVTDFEKMFLNAESFNQDLGSWDMRSATTVREMFLSAVSFNQDLGAWQLNKLVSSNEKMLFNSGMDCRNYSSTLLGWSKNDNLSTGVDLDSVNLEYSENAKRARNVLIKQKNWTVTGDQESQNCDFCNFEASAIRLTSDNCETACDGEAAVLTLNGEAPYTYNWSNGDSERTSRGLCPGNTSVTIEDNMGCIGVTFVSIDSSWPALSIETQDASCDNCSDGSVSIFPENLIYQWEMGETSQQLIGLSPGEYDVTVTNDDNCLKTYTVRIGPGDFKGNLFEDSEFQDTIGLIESPLKGETPFEKFDLNFSIDSELRNSQSERGSSLEIYPNPVRDKLHIRLEGVDSGQILIINSYGQRVQSLKFEKDQKSLYFDVSYLPSGLYIVRAGHNIQRFIKI